MTDLAEAALEAFTTGWVLSGAPLSERYPPRAVAAITTALDYAGDPGVLEVTLDLGHLEGIWATIYARRDALIRKHTKRVMAAWNAIVRDLDTRQLVSRFRSAIYLPAETTNPHGQFWRDTAIATALAWLRQIYTASGFGDLVAAITDAIRSGMAEGEAGALALAASRQGKTGFGIAAAFKTAYKRLGGSFTIGSKAQDAVTRIIDGAGSDAGRKLASLAADGASAGDMNSAAEDVVSGPGVQSVSIWLDWAMYAAIGTAALDLYGSANAQTVKWITAGDRYVCASCETNEADSPFPVDDVPPYPGHPRCRCYLDSDDPGLSAQLMAYYFG